MQTILVVDDSDSIRKLLEVTLRTRGFAVVSAADGQDALETLERHTDNDRVGFNVIVLDINMPRLDGLSLLTLVRARPEWQALPILMLTTEGRDEDRDRALALGANDYMIKPFKPSELIIRVMALLATLSYEATKFTDSREKLARSDAWNSLPKESLMPADLSDFDADILAQMRDDFLTEAQEILDRLGPLLAQLEQNRSPEVINGIFREVHTLKGAAGFMGLAHIQRLSHRLEDTFGDIRAGRLGVTPALIDLAFDGLQRLAVMRADAARGGKGEAELEPLLTQLDAARRGEIILNRAKTGLLTPVAPTGTTPAETEAPPFPITEATLRVDVETVDELLAMVGELITSRNSLNAIAERMHDEALRSNASAMSRLARQLQALVMEVRLVPVERLFNRFVPVVRNLARELGKPAQLVIEGGSTPFDRTVSEQMYDPLIHLIRNALDHGLESPADRQQAGKPETGTLRLAAERRGDNVILRVSDDGRGMDPAQLRRVAIERNLLTPSEAAALTDDQVIRLIFTPGFSTTSAITDLSGRGVGMDVVLQNVRRLRGSIEIETVLGGGTTFVIELPLTLAILHVLLARVGGQCYALPLHTVRETLLLNNEALQTMQRREVLFLRGQPLPVRRLDEWLGHPAPLKGQVQPAIVVSLTRGPEVLVVDELLGKQQMVIKPLSPYLGLVEGVEGAAILPDGKVTLILDIEKLITA